jgi:hypothetical protein
VALTVDNILQEATGSFEGTSGTITLPGGTTAGSLVLVVAAAADAHAQALDAPSGGAGTWTDWAHSQGSTNRANTHIWTQKGVAGGESSWTLAVAGGAPTSELVMWAVYELSGVGVVLADSLGASDGPTAASDTTVASFTTGTAPADGSSTEAFLALGVAVFAATSADTTPPVITVSDADLFYERDHVDTANATRAASMSVAMQTVQDVGVFQTSASVSPSAYMAANMLILYADDSPWVPSIDFMSGFEFGTATGMTTGSEAVAGCAPFDAVVGSPAVVSTFKRSGSYALQLSSSAAAECVTATSAGALGYYGSSVGWGSRAFVERCCVYFDTSLPGADTELLSVEAGSLANGVVVWYRSASQKIGVKIGSGTEQLSDATVAANTWIGLDIRYDPRTTTHRCDWKVDYDSLDATVAPVAQAQATATGMTATAITTARWGWTTSKTATVYYDDIAVSRFFGTFPLGDYRILPLLPDQTGTPTITGTTANFQTFTSGGTGAAWNAATARTLVDDMPPVVGGSADGIMQVTAATGDFVTIPMATYTAAPMYSPRAVRWYVAGWAASGSVANCNVKADDGTNTLMDIGYQVGSGTSLALDHGWDASVVHWLCSMHRLNPVVFPQPYYQITQARLDALAVKFGYSTDATPDVGVNAVLAEVAVQPAKVFTISETTLDGGTAYLYTRQDPVHQGCVSLLVTTPPGTQQVVLQTTINDSYSEQVVPANTTYELPIGSDNVGTVSTYGLRTGD